MTPDFSSLDTEPARLIDLAHQVMVTSHGIVNDFWGIGSLTELIGSRLQDEPPQVGQDLELIRKFTEKLSKSFQQLDIQAREASPLRLMPLDLVEIARQSQERIAPLAGPSVEWRIELAEPCRLIGSRPHLDRMMDHLLIHFVQRQSEEGRTIRVGIASSATPTGSALLTVGMPGVVRESVQAAERLRIAKSIWRRHQGQLHEDGQDERHAVRLVLPVSRMISSGESQLSDQINSSA